MVQLYHTKSALADNGCSAARFLEDDWPRIMDIIDKMGSVNSSVDPETLNTSFKRCLQIAMEVTSGRKVQAKTRKQKSIKKKWEDGIEEGNKPEEEGIEADLGDNKRRARLTAASIPIGQRAHLHQLQTAPQNACLMEDSGIVCTTVLDTLSLCPRRTLNLDRADHTELMGCCSSMIEETGDETALQVYTQVMDRGSGSLGKRHQDIECQTKNQEASGTESCTSTQPEPTQTQVFGTSTPPELAQAQVVVTTLQGFTPALPILQSMPSHRLQQLIRGCITAHPPLQGLHKHWWLQPNQ